MKCLNLPWTNSWVTANVFYFNGIGKRALLETTNIRYQGNVRKGGVATANHIYCVDRASMLQATEGRVGP